MTTGFADLNAAFQAAAEELGEAPLGDSDEAMPASEEESVEVEEQAVDGEVEQPDVAETTDDDRDEELQSLVDELAGGEDEAEGDTPAAEPISEFLASDDFWTTEVEVPNGDGTETKTVQELVDGYLRQSDYTKKTQQVAEDRRTNEEAVEFHRAFNEDPMAFAYTLAVKANLIEEGAQPVKPLDVAKFTSPEEYEAEIERRVEERFTSDERFTAMQTAEAQRNVDAVFSQLEKDRGVTLTESVRRHLLDKAIESGTADLAQVFDAEMYRRQLARDRASEAKRKAPSRPTRTGSTVPQGEKPVVVESIDDAFDRALAELGAA